MDRDGLRVQSGLACIVDEDVDGIKGCCMLTVQGQKELKDGIDLKERPDRRTLRLGSLILSYVAENLQQVDRLEPAHICTEYDGLDYREIEKNPDKEDPSSWSRPKFRVCRSTRRPHL